VSAWRPSDGEAWGLPASDLWAAPTVGPQTDPGVVARGRVRRLARRLLAICTVQPVVLVFEDVHLLDVGAAEALKALLDRLALSPGPRPLLLLTARPEPPVAEAFAAREDCALLDLAPLTRAQVAELASNMLGAQTPAELTLSLATHIFDLSQGNALRARTVVQSLIHSRALELTPAGWRFRADTGRHMLIDDLSEPAARALSAAAILGNAFDLDLLCALTETDEDPLLDVLDEALRHGIVASAAGAPHLDAYVFSHARFPAQLAARLPEAERRSLHVCAGRLLEVRGAAPAIVAAHLRHSPDDAVAWPALMAAGDAATEAYQLARALDFYEAAEARCADDEDRGHLTERRADALVVVGRPKEAVPLFERLVGEVHQADRRVGIWRKLGNARMRADDVIGGIRSLERALRAAGVRPARTRLGRLFGILRDDLVATLRERLRGPRRPSARLQQCALAHAQLAFAARWLDNERTAEHAAAYRRVAVRLGEPALLLDARIAFSMVLSFSGQLVRGARMQTQALAAAEAELELPVALIDGVGGVAGMIELAQDKPEAAVRRLTAAIARAQREGDLFATGMATAARGWAQLYVGRWSEGWADFADGARMARSLDLSWMAADALAGQAYVHAYRGEYDEAVAATSELDAMARALHLEAYEGVAAEVRGWACFFDRRYEEAVRDLSHAQAFFAERNLQRMWGYPVNLGLAEAWLRARDHGHVTEEALLRALDRLARFFRYRLFRVHMQRGFGTFVRGVAAARRGQGRRAERLFARSRRQRGDGATFWDAYLLARSAIELHQLGQPRAETLPHAERALAILEGMDVPGLAPLVRDVCERIRG